MSFSKRVLMMAIEKDLLSTLTIRHLPWIHMTIGRSSRMHITKGRLPRQSPQMTSIPKYPGCEMLRNRLLLTSTTMVKSVVCYWRIMSIMRCLTLWCQYSSTLPIILRQPQFDVLAGKASRRYDNGRVEIGDELPKPHTLDKYWNYFENMQGNASIIRFSDNQGTTHHLPYSKGGQQKDGLETICFACHHASVYQ